MQIEIHIILDNYTNYKQIKINFNSLNISELLNYLYVHNIIYSPDYIVFYNNSKIEKLPNLDNLSIIIRENKIYKSCSCTRNKCHL